MEIIRSPKNKMNCRYCKYLMIAFLISAGILATFRVNAQQGDSSKTFHVLLEPYLFFTSMSGTIGLGNLPNTFICVPASQVFSYLKIGGMLYAEVHNDHLAFTSDILYASLVQDASSKNDITSGTASFTQFLWELAGLYKVTSWIEFGAGARITNIKAGLNINVSAPAGTVSREKENTETWADPVIIARLRTIVHNGWLLQLRADIGGFGVGSRFAWQLQPDIHYRASRLLDLGLSYRILSMDYNQGNEDSRFLYNMDEYGPQIRIGFHL